MKEKKSYLYDYNSSGQGYANQRRTDPRIAKYVNQALSSAQSVLNVGAGTGSYEPEDKYVVALEPSKVMRGQRNTIGKVPAVIGTAEALPFDDNSFDAAMAMVTIHHWSDIAKGLQELRRVARNRVLVMTFDPASLSNFWNVHYFPEVINAEKARYPSIDFINETLGGNCDIFSIPIPFDCTDGFQEAYYGRPEEFLRKEVRQSQSAWGFVSKSIEESYVKHLEEDLRTGKWDQQFGEYRAKESFTCSLRLIISK